MATLKEAIYKILQDDAKLSTTGHLGNLLGKSTVAPYGVYYQNPPTTPVAPYITYSVVSMSERMPRVIAYNVMVWGDNFEAIHKLVYGLLHKKRLVITDYSSPMIFWDWSAPEMWHEDLKIYFQQQRYIVKAVI